MVVAKVNIRDLKEAVDKHKKEAESLKGEFCFLPEHLLELPDLEDKVTCRVHEVDLSEGYVGVVFTDPYPDLGEEAIELIEYVDIGKFQYYVEWWD